MERADATARIAGLTSAEVSERVRQGLVNRQDFSTSRSLGAIVRANTLTYFNAIVLSGFALLLLLGRWQDALFGLTALANVVIGAGQELRAKRTLDRLSVLNASRTRVLRDGEEREVEPGEVVLGDVLVLAAGDQVSADAVVVTAEHLSIDESLLTGEAEPVPREVGQTLLSGSAVVGGSVLARVSAVGASSFANRLTAESRRFSLVRSELRESLDRLLRWIGWAVLPLGLLVLNAQVQVQGGWGPAAADGRWQVAAVDTVAALIAMIPLGLVLMTSVAFAVGAVALAREQVLVQELPAVEGLARIDVLCIDKTGTLTDGSPVLDTVVPVPGVAPPAAESWRAALAWFGADAAAGPTVRSLARDYPENDGVRASARIGFSSERKWSAAALTGKASGTWVLGAPDVIAGLPEFSTEDYDTQAVRAAGELSASGLRTLMLARASGPLTPDQVADEKPPEGLRATAVLAFREQLRPDATTTLAYLREEGVDVRVISGDHPRTVAAVAEAAGLGPHRGFDARELPEDPVAFAAAVVDHPVIGRVTPDQKRRIVHALQSAGHTVAMTGDGVNDALAVKDADLGIAMGSGSAATKAVARLVLLDDSFEHIPDVVAQGRRVLANIERVAVLFLTKTVYAMALSIGLGSLLLETPFLPRQLSVTDGLTIGIPAFFLALLPNRRRHAPGFLRRALTSALPNGVIVGACLLAVAIVGDAAGLGGDQVRSVATLVLTAAGLWVLTCQARPLTGWRIVVVLSMVGAAALVYLLPWSVRFLQFAAPPPWFSALGACVALTGCACIEIVHRVTIPWVTRVSPGA
ncbi:HAD-IC family P-type ATPase [Sinomonas humi]|uniref:HAD-IC family P-type ATPase n=1 Tax=Sinomonas humi TaxID=1338436 RepID=UPI00068A14FD|nr:HAD-IC family P-type ATPase [Sinomonas humi]